MNTIMLVIGVAAGAAIMWGMLNLFNRLAPKNDTRSSTSFSEVVRTNEMISLCCSFQDVIVNEKTGLYFSSSKIVLTCKGTIECRFDMSKAVLNVDEGTKRTAIEMPPCKIEENIKMEDVNVRDINKG